MTASPVSGSPPSRPPSSAKPEEMITAFSTPAGSGSRRASALSSCGRGACCGGVSARVRLALARCLIELDRLAEAEDQVRASLSAGPTAAERAQAAVFLKELGQPALAITDHGCLFGVIDFYLKARAEGVKPIAKVARTAESPMRIRVGLEGFPWLRV